MTKSNKPAYIDILPNYLKSDEIIDYHGATIHPKTETESEVFFVSRVVIALHTAGLITEVMELNAKFQQYVELYGEPE